MSQPAACQPHQQHHGEHDGGRAANEGLLAGQLEGLGRDVGWQGSSLLAGSALRPGAGGLRQAQAPAQQQALIASSSIGSPDRLSCSTAYLQDATPRAGSLSAQLWDAGATTQAERVAEAAIMACACSAGLLVDQRASKLSSIC